MTSASAGDTSRTVANMFNMLDAWRHLPGYRLEGRLAPFFELFLHNVLGERLGIELHPVVIPEFPLRKGTLCGDKNLKRPNQSYNVDYVAFSKGRKQKTAFLIELKTDMSSIGGGQKKYLRDALDMGFAPLVGGIIEICKATDYQSKYAHLLHLMASLELVSIYEPEKLYQAAQSRTSWRDALEGAPKSGPVSTNVDRMPQCIRVIFIQPRERNPEPGFDYIYFTHVADIVQKYGDIGCVFANYLRQWIKDPGSQPPQKAVPGL